MLNDNDDPIPKSILNNKRYQAAATFMENIKPKEGVEYGWVYEYAKKLWEERNKLFVRFDEKADSIIKYLGGGVGLFAIGVLSKIDSSNYYLAYCTFPSLLSAAVSLFFAAWVRKPMKIPDIPTVENAVEYAEQWTGARDSETYFLGQWHLANETMELANETKSRRLQVATWAYFGALALLTIPVVVGTIWPPVPHQPKSEPVRVIIQQEK